jgi:hypothetical protein
MASFICTTWSLVLWKYYLRYDHELLDLLQQRQYRYSMNDYVSLWYSWINLVVLIVRLQNKIRKLYGMIGKANNNASLMSEEIFYYTTILCIKWQGLRIVYTQEIHKYIISFLEQLIFNTFDCDECRNRLNKTLWTTFHYQYHKLIISENTCFTTLCVDNS